MKALKRILYTALVMAGFSFSAAISHAQDPPPFDYTPEWLDYWSFNNTNTWETEFGYAAVSATNIQPCIYGDYWAAMVDNTNGPAWLHYNITENDGTNHFRVDEGSIMFWFAPNWSSTNQDGTGPGEWSRLIEVGSYTTNASYGWWGLYLDPDGVNIYFGAQTNDGSEATYLSAPISWNVTNRWHFLTLTYTETNSALWLDAVPITNGLGVTYMPGPDVLTNGFFIGSDSNGLLQAHGIFDDFATYDHVVSGDTITNTFYDECWLYWANPLNQANFLIASAPSTSSVAPVFNAITGSGYLTPLGTNTTNCIINSNIWLTNIMVMASNNQTMNIQFMIAGGSNGVLYDVFANSVLDFSNNTNRAWAWMGQGYHCTTYLLTNLPSSNTTCFLILGQPYDPDGDGLTSAYEKLVSKTDPNVASTDGTGLWDGWEILYFGHTGGGINPNDDSDGDGLSNYTEFRMLSGRYDPTKWNTFGAVGDGYQDYIGDGLANLMKASFGGNMFTNNPTWKVNWSGDGLSDEYKTMVGLSTNTAQSAPTLPTYSKDPIP